MHTKIVTIGLVESLPAMRKGLALFLQQNSFCTVILEAADGIQLQNELRKAKEVPDIILLEVEMCGIATASWLQFNYPNLPVIIYTRCETELTAEKFYGFGVKAILQKSGCEKDLLKAIGRVLEDGYYYSDPSSWKCLMHLYKNNNQPQSLKPLLTERE